MLSNFGQFGWNSGGGRRSWNKNVFCSFFVPGEEDEMKQSIII
jgi:hypothetical protein